MRFQGRVLKGSLGGGHKTSYCTLSKLSIPLSRSIVLPNVCVVKPDSIGSKFDFESGPLSCAIKKATSMK